MCGIAGAIGAVDSRLIEKVERMLGAMTHRGPDQDGLWHSNRAVLGHRRLSIIDVSAAGRQPMVDPDSGVVLTYNGECYNYVQLRAELEGLGRRFVSDSDSEVVLAAYVQWGAAATQRLRGMFALGVWDPRNDTLTLARDRLGIKPLYWCHDAGAVLFSSELRPLLNAVSERPRLDRSALAAYVWHGFVPGPGTLVEHIHLLDASTTMQVGRDGSPVFARYWEMPRCTEGEKAETATASIRRVRSVLDDAVKLHMVSDVPLGVFLSGGVDSSVLAAMAQQSSCGPVRTFNISFQESAFDESRFARQVADTLGTEHHELTLTEEVFSDHLDDALESLDQPTFDGINSYFVSHAVQEAGLKVALAGTGGDELFGGYRSFVDLPRAAKLTRALAAVPDSWRKTAADLAVRISSGTRAQVPAQTRWGKLADVLETGGDTVALYQVSYALFTRAMWTRLLSHGVQDLRWGLSLEKLQEWQAMIQGCRGLPAITSLELSSFLGERLLRDTDCASMASSLEVRVPLLDHVFVEAVSAVPDAVRYHPIRRKQMLKQIVQDRLDPAIFNRKKAGFELPLGIWCRQRLARRIASTMLDVDLVQSVGLNPDAVAGTWRAFKAGGKGLHWSRIWALYVLLHWCERHGIHT